ncbi:MAG: arylamine N-acetyltransferase [Acidobacteria bacterium]|nr:MAG: arylamine N-acetyltransferase [Acidobacteriota bacterium]
MKETVFDLDAYLERIGYAGERTPTLDTLGAIHRHHTRAIPFENMNPFLGWPVRLDIGSLQEKIVSSGRGGYCFEQNLLLTHALHAMGFSVVGLAARVLYNVPAGVVPARSHMLLRIAINGSAYIADVGFGGLTLTDPLRLEPGVEQTTSHEPFRLMAERDEFVMQALVGGTWRALYRFGLQEQLQVDYEVTNWYLSNHPQSLFVTNLIAARVDIDRRYALRNNELAVHHLGGRTERQVLTGPAELREVLEGRLKIAVPDAPGLDVALGRLTVAQETNQ